MLRTFRGGLLIGLAVAVAVAAGAFTYERYDTKSPSGDFRPDYIVF
jgi:general L-amino acid transport system substrate-binding protein